MSKTPFLAAAILAAAFLTFSAYAQETKKEVATKPVLSPSQAVLESWNDIGRKLTAMAEDFPEDKYDFKPTPAQRSFAEQLLHAANANYFCDRCFDLTGWRSIPYYWAQRAAVPAGRRFRFCGFAGAAHRSI